MLSLHRVFPMPLAIAGIIGVMASAPPKITVDPDPLKAGQSGLICYKFDKDDPSPVTLEITWQTLTGTNVETIQVSREESCKKITVPSDAIAVTIEDLTGDSADYGGSVQ